MHSTHRRPEPTRPPRGPTGLHLYVIQSHVTGAVKIGRSSDPERRLLSLQTGSPHRLRLLASYEGRGEEERNLHRLLRRFRLKQEGEWFAASCLNELPEWVYDKLPFNDDWWMRT